ncbi:hypothetical protein M8C21_027601 [Ambrosia artemisiifolia]|uniref:Uncharacterized protein n=1 Tax=Ambrosia artemisiifolia TaxID=4212 RepID=A0AAD5G3D1_AMBAR|nr:hypothetical protein M8C21_027601 [Ambrosia artemisiifolia]
MELKTDWVVQGCWDWARQPSNVAEMVEFTKYNAAIQRFNLTGSEYACHWTTASSDRIRKCQEAFIREWKMWPGLVKTAKEGVDAAEWSICCCRMEFWGPTRADVAKRRGRKLHCCSNKLRYFDLDSHANTLFVETKGGMIVVALAFAGHREGSNDVNVSITSSNDEYRYAGELSESSSSRTTNVLQALLLHIVAVTLGSSLWVT